MRPVVFNASPLIVLARAGYLEMMREILSPAFVPRAVVDEINAGPDGDPAVTALSRSTWLQVVDLVPGVSPMAAWRLGKGESEVLEYARQHPGTTAALDDMAARRAGKILGVPVIGSLGLLVAAADKGLLSSLPDGLDTVVRAGLYVHPETMAALRKE